MSGMIMSYSGGGRNISSAFSVEAEAELSQLMQKLVYGKGVRRKSWSWRADGFMTGTV